MGIKMLLQKETNFDTLKNKMIVPDISSRKLYLKALGVALSNPKAIVFLTALFPQFINTNQSLMPQFTSLIAVLILFSFSCLMTYALLASQVKNWLTKPGRIKIVNRISGTMFIGFGALLAASSRK
jgi:threonine/homoserine/homoserine lactone efflux protein